jgi:hypothetical protein
MVSSKKVFTNSPSLYLPPARGGRTIREILPGYLWDLIITFGKLVDRSQ